MTNFLVKLWEVALRSHILRPKRFQVAALCYRNTGSGKDVLLITSRGTGRWIVPKGWPIDGLDAPASALQEAWEEAGVKSARIDQNPIGSYDYIKELNSGAVAPVSTDVYLTEVDGLSDTYPEADQRARAWIPAPDAAEMVRESGLKRILRNL